MDHDHSMHATTMGHHDHFDNSTGDGGHGDGDHGDGGHGGGGMMHGMSFYASAHATILFKGWMTMTWAEMLGSCAAVLVMAVLYEALKVGRELLHDRYGRGIGSSHSSSVDIVITDGKKQHSRRSYRKLFEPLHVIQSLLYFVQLWLSLCLMLVFMTFNVYLCLAVTVGGALGYYLFAWASTSPPGRENMCH